MGVQVPPRASCGRGSVVEHRLAKARVAGSNPVVRSIYVPLAQPDRAFDYESKGREFESLRARHLSRDVAQFGRAPGLGPGGRMFKSCRPDHFYCGCSLVVKPQPSKLLSRVRFPSPAPSEKPRKSAVFLLYSHISCIKTRLNLHTYGHKSCSMGCCEDGNFNFQYIGAYFFT